MSDEPYVMNPETDDLIYAYQLRNEMVVRAERPARVVGAQPVWNTWCKTTQVECADDRVYFIAVGEDGRKATYECSPNVGWFVKKDSMPQKDPAFEKCILWDLDCRGTVMGTYPKGPDSLTLVCTYHHPVLYKDVPLARVKSVIETSAGIAVGLEPTHIGREFLKQQARMDLSHLHDTFGQTETPEDRDREVADMQDYNDTVRYTEENAGLD